MQKHGFLSSSDLGARIMDTSSPMRGQMTSPLPHFHSRLWLLTKSIEHKVQPIQTVMRHMILPSEPTASCGTIDISSDLFWTVIYQVFLISRLGATSTGHGASCSICINCSRAHKSKRQCFRLEIAQRTDIGNNVKNGTVGSLLPLSQHLCMTILRRSIGARKKQKMTPPRTGVLLR